MADWRGISEGISRGFERGAATGGKLSGLGAVIGQIADRLRSQREQGEALSQKQNLLGYEGLIKGTVEPTKETGEGTFDIPGMGKMRRVEQVTAVINPETGQLEYKMPKGAKFKPTEKKEITKATALGIISDPFKSKQLKDTYPDLYAVVEEIAQGNNSQVSMDSGEKRIKIIDKSGSEFTIPESQLQEALNSGYKRALK